MAKRRIKRSARARASRPQSNSTQSMEENIKEAHDEAESLVTAEDKAVVVGDDPKPDDVDLDKMWEIVRETRDCFTAKKNEFEERDRDLNAKETDLDAREENLGRREKELQEERGALSEREREIIDREETLKRQESDFQRREKESERDLLEKETELNNRQEAMVDERRKMESRERKLNWCERDLDELKNDLQERKDFLAARERESFEGQIKALEERLQQARRDRDALDEKLQEREDADRRFGHRSADEVCQHIKMLEEKNKELQAALAELPDAGAAERLDNLEREKEQWQAERMELRQRELKLKKRLDNYNHDANEREVQRDLIESLHAQRVLLQTAHDQIRSEIDDLRSRNDAESPFPACRAMDENLDLQSQADTESSGDLASFVDDLRNRIASESLYYTLEDLRSFIGGLAMSKLILLQGISGTGKTSLPMAFARAVGTAAAVIEVQAGWRDPQDLVGHYNVFEKRFYEKEFLKALYRSQTPYGEDTIRIILLDEMNLSHPEQYFSDLLSALELPEQEQQLVLMPNSIEQEPMLLRDGKLPIPPNVWFVGTANHDETTMDFADKTYDRAHIMEFPHRPEPFEAAKPNSRRPISFRALLNAFEKAIRDDEERYRSADKIIHFFESVVRQPLAEHFELGWGPRLERQIRRYAPVVVAAGGTIGEAADHILTMRLLRKLNRRHDNPLEPLEKLQNEIKEWWSVALDEQSKPTRSIKFLNTEIRRMGGNPESDE